MATATTAQQPKGSAINVVAWRFTFVTCLYFAWAYVGLSRRTTIFANMFASMNVDLPLATRLLIADRLVIYPTLFVGASIALIVKEVYMRDKKLSLATTAIVGLTVMTVYGWIVDALYAPLYTMIEKLK